MGITERHWFEDEEPELTDRQLEDAVYDDKKIFLVRCKDCKWGNVAKMDREKVIQRIEIAINGCKEIKCEDCCYFNSKEPHKPRCGFTDAQEKQSFIDVLALLKEQEAEIRQLRLALDIAKGTCKGIVMEGR